MLLYVKVENRPEVFESAVIYQSLNMSCQPMFIRSSCCALTKESDKHREGQTIDLAMFISRRCHYRKYGIEDVPYHLDTFELWAVSEPNELGLECVNVIRYLCLPVQEFE